MDHDEYSRKSPRELWLDHEITWMDPVLSNVNQSRRRENNVFVASSRMKWTCVKYQERKKRRKTERRKHFSLFVREYQIYIYLVNTKLSS